nr:MAG TPA: hypothetical protein [Caudoviricetes sp.]
MIGLLGLILQKPQAPNSMLVVPCMRRPLLHLL